jgi:hypothetical protein
MSLLIVVAAVVVIVVATVVVIVVATVVVIVVPLVGGLIVLLTRSRHRAPPTPAPTVPPVQPPVAFPPMAPATPGPDPTAATERDRLVHTLITVRDQLDSVALRAWIDEALGQVGGPDVARARERLVRTLVDVRDQVTDPALRATIVEALGHAGVHEIVADGQRFDPNAHRALDYVVVADPACDHVVAQTSRPGYIDHGRVLRLPDVLVYRAGDRR